MTFLTRLETPADFGGRKRGWLPGAHGIHQFGKCGREPWGVDQHRAPLNGDFLACLQAHRTALNHPDTDFRAA